MVILTALLASFVAAAPARSGGPAACAGNAAVVEPDTLDDLAGCQRRALDAAAAAYARAHGGGLPADALVARWTKTQEAEKKAYLARHPDRAAPAAEEAAAIVEPAPEPEPSGKSLMIYVAPWCPHCREATPRINALRAYLTKKGVETRIIVGGDDADKCQDYARSFGPNTEVDPTGVQAPHGGVPHFLVMARDGSVIKNQAGVDPSGSAEELASELGLP